MLGNTLLYSLIMSFVGVTLFKVLTEEGKPLNEWLEFIRKKFNTPIKPTPKKQTYSLKNPTNNNQIVGFQKSKPSPTKWRFDVLGGCVVCSTMQLTYWLYIPVMTQNNFAIKLSTIAFIIALVSILIKRIPCICSALIAAFMFLWNFLIVISPDLNLSPHAYHIGLSTLSVGFFVAIWEYFYNKYLVLR